MPEPSLLLRHALNRYEKVLATLPVIERMSDDPKELNAMIGMTRVCEAYLSSARKALEMELKDHD